MKIAIVGGGIFGVTAAWMLAQNNFSVDLYEKGKDIFSAASGINQYRVHRGYHYPRSRETILTCCQGEQEFSKVYGEAIMDDNIEHYYSIMKEGSLISSEDCLKVWDDCNLEYEIVDLDIVNKEKVALSLKVKESLFDPLILKKICWENLKKYKVNVFLEKEVRYSDLNDYDLIVVATYALNNQILEDFPQAHRNYQFEVCEKLVLKLPEKYRNKSVVIIDGPFMCIDPFGRTGLFAMGNVVHAIHNTNIGKFPEIPEQFKGLLNNGVITNPSLTNFDKFIKSAAQFFPGIEEAEHIGSMYTIRTVLPFRNHDDARPTIVEQVNDRTISLFSGKIPTCIDSGKQVLSIANKMRELKEAALN